MMKWYLSLLLVSTLLRVDGQNYSLLQEKRNELREIENYATPEKINQWWNQLTELSLVPLIVNDSVYFLYRGNATSVEWMGDFNGWGYHKDLSYKGSRIKGTDIWLLKASFPEDARLDYKILVDGKNWVLDPENKYQQWSGVGGGSPNSELRMPLWKFDPIHEVRSNVARGTIISDVLLNSKTLGYQITYSVYLPIGYTKEKPIATIYVTDGYEYLHPKLGNMSVVLDNLITDKKIPPVIAVFVDHREPINRSNNRRMQELAMNPKYLEFFTSELIPKIENEFSTIADAQHRAILGTSMGGLTATYFSFTRPDVFGMAGIQSPAFYTRPQIYSLCANPADPKMKISMTSGLINDTSLESRKMKEILEANSCIYHYHELNEGHSWGNWRQLIDDILIDLFTGSR